ncbi:hypothetical protein TNCV_3149481 [Trichonephila clavipes]|nr:hypothetical protein TNCV_3149481 [Trichonephila clavipes]
MIAAIAAPPNMNIKEGMRCTLHTMSSNETCSCLRKYIKSKAFLSMDVSRSKQCVVCTVSDWGSCIHTKAASVERLANQRLHLARDEVSDWLDAQRSTLTALV